jgi:hypothetical protein
MDYQLQVMKVNGLLDLVPMFPAAHFLPIRDFSR